MVPSSVVTLRHSTSAVVCGLLAWLTPALARAGSPDWSRPRDLPSLVPLWRFDVQACRAELVDGTLYALATDRIVALDVRTGTRRWESPFEGGCYLSTLVVGADFVAAGKEEVVRVVDRASGALRRSVPGRMSSVVPTADANTGAQGRALPERDPDDCSTKYGDGLPWDLLPAPQGPDFSCFAVRRYSRETGKPLWRVELPGGPAAAARWHDLVFVHADPRPGRGYLMALDWKDGALRRAAYSLGDVRIMHILDDHLILTGSGGVVAVSARAFGPPESQLIPVRDAVRAVVSRPADDDTRAELQAMGPEALPVLVAILPSMDDAHATPAAYAVASGRYRSAAPVVAERLGRSLSTTGEKAEDHRVALLAALSGTGGAAEVPVVQKVVDDATQPTRVREAALRALAGIGPPAGAAIDRVLDRPQARRSWWRPPSPGGDGTEIGRPLTEAALEAALTREDMSEYYRLLLVASGARAPLPEGGAVLAFVHPWLGNSRDLWVARLDAEGRLGPSRFLGALRPGTDGCWEKCRLAARVSGTVLEVRRTDAPAGAVTVDLRDVDQDSDGDELTDVVEKRLATDPQRADTDGDGTEDAFDSNPATPARRPDGEEQEIAADIFQQVFLFERDYRGLVVVASPFALEWRGREDPTVTVPADGFEGFTQRTGARATLFSVGPETEHMFFEAPRLEPNERDYAYSLGGGSSWVVVRKIGRHWVIRGVYRSIAR